MRVGGRTPRAIDVRFLAATNRDVERDVEEGNLRQDLYFRLNGITLNIPPLRERSADVGPLAEHFAAAICKAEGRATPRVSPGAVAALEGHSWPGNVRELRNVIERALLLCDGDTLLPEHLPARVLGSAARAPGPAAGGPPPSERDKLLQQMESLERQRVVDALARCGGNQTKAALELGISRRTLVSRLGAYDLPRPRKQGPG
jgi:DNA-binding NtrC family response regulator